MKEQDVENMAIELLRAQGYKLLLPNGQVLPSGPIPPSEVVLSGRPGLSHTSLQERDLRQVVLEENLQKAIDRLNPSVPAEARQQALQALVNLSGSSAIAANEVFHTMLVNGFEAEHYQNEGSQGTRVHLIDFNEPLNNEFLVAQQFEVMYGEVKKIPDLVLFVNGLPLVVIELKNPSDEKATLEKAVKQLSNYKKSIPQLFYYNAVLVVSDGHDARAGTLTSEFTRFMPWKHAAANKPSEAGGSSGANELSVSGGAAASSQLAADQTSTSQPQIEALIQNMLHPRVLLDLIKNFTVFEKHMVQHKATGLQEEVTNKKTAAYHQYYMVNKALRCTGQAIKSDRKIGVVWHTQGSGKSLSMVFYAGLAIQKFDNPTIVVITDRNDLDGQLKDTFAGCQQLLRQKPQQAESTSHLKKLLKTQGGGVVFTTIQKFFPDHTSSQFELLSSRKNIIVIADEAHRSQYGFKMKTRISGNEAHTSYGFAKHVRDALPQASFVGFTGTPIEKEDVSTRAVFGDYIDVYDMQQSVQDGATVKIYYEQRMVNVHLPDEAKVEVDDELDRFEAQGKSAEMEASNASSEVSLQKLKTRLARQEAIIGHPDRVEQIAHDIVDHFTRRAEVFDGKAMVVVSSRKLAVAMYDAIVKLCPDWHSKEKTRGQLKVVMTSSSSDPASWQPHNTTSEERRRLGDRFKKPFDELKMVIVCDMWLTGFDVPCLYTMYVDKIMKSHNVMQAIARVNRVYKEKAGGLIIDYIGMAAELKKAVSLYPKSGGRGLPVEDKEKAIDLMIEKFTIVDQMFFNFDYKVYFTASTRDKLQLILRAQNHILGLPQVGRDSGRDRFVKHTTELLKAYALVSPDEQANKIRDAVGFFQALKARLAKFETPAGAASRIEVETAIKQIIDKALVVEGVVDVFEAAGVQKPDLSILSDEFLNEIQAMKHKNLAVELLKKLLRDEIKGRQSTRLFQSKKLSKMLEQAIQKYQSNLITAVQVIEELIELARYIRKEDQKGSELNLDKNEVAFYEAILLNDSAAKLMQDTQLRGLACALVKHIKRNTSPDWRHRENSRAKLRIAVKKLLKKYGYPPDQQKLAIDNVLQQAEQLASQIA